MSKRAKSNHKDSAWYDAQRHVSSWLKSRGIGVAFAGYYAPFDLITDAGKRIEVKWSPYKNFSWKFNIHRHGSVSEGDVDVYVLRCQGCKELGFSSAFHLVIPAPLSTPTIDVSPRSLITRWARYYNNFSVFEETHNGNASK